MCRALTDMLLKVWAQQEASGYTQQDARNTSSGQEYNPPSPVSITEVTISSFHRKYLNSRRRQRHTILQSRRCYFTSPGCCCCTKYMLIKAILNVLEISEDKKEEFLNTL